MYDHFETSSRETAIDIIPFKEKHKKISPWENPDICLKWDMLKTEAQLKNSCSTIENINSYYLSQRALYDTYDTQQEIYLQSKIDEIKCAVSNQKSACSWKVVNDITSRKKNNKPKIKSTSGEERIKL